MSNCCTIFLPGACFEFFSNGYSVVIWPQDNCNFLYLSLAASYFSVRGVARNFGLGASPT